MLHLYHIHTAHSFVNTTSLPGKLPKNLLPHSEKDKNETFPIKQPIKCHKTKKQTIWRINYSKLRLRVQKQCASTVYPVSNSIRLFK